MERSLKDIEKSTTGGSQKVHSDYAGNLPKQKSTQARKLPSMNGKRANDFEFSEPHRQGDLSNGNGLDGLPYKKSNVATKMNARTNGPDELFKNIRGPDVDENEYDEDEDDEEAEMTTDEKQEMYKAVTEGDIDLLEDLLDKPDADIGMLWFGENLLMGAIRSTQEEMAEYLIDNGVDYNFQTKVIDMEDTANGNQSAKADVYNVSCRQMAYDKGLSDIVELIDYKNGNLFSFVKPKDRKPRMRRPQKTDSPDGADSYIIERADDQASVASSRDSEKDMKMYSRRSSSDHENRDFDTDSGHHSDVSRKEDAYNDSPDTSFDKGKEEFRSGKALPLDEGYFSISPNSSRRGTPTSKSDATKPAFIVRSTKSALRRETSKSAGVSESTARREVNAVGSYSRESVKWAPKGKRSSSKERELDVSVEDNPPALVRTQSPWQDDRPSHSRRHRRLPATPTNNAPVHKPRIMSPPSQLGNRVPSKILSQSKIVTLPNKLSFPSLRNTTRATDIEIRGEKRTDNSSRSPVRAQIQYGRNVSTVDSNHSKKYDEHFVINTELLKRKKPGHRT